MVVVKNHAQPKSLVMKQSLIAICVRSDFQVIPHLNQKLHPEEGEQQEGPLFFTISLIYVILILALMTIKQLLAFW